MYICLNKFVQADPWWNLTQWLEIYRRMEMDTPPAIVFQQKMIVLEEFKSVSLQAVLNKNKPYDIVTIKHIWFICSN